MLTVPPFSERSETFRARAREFVAAELRPHAEAWEAACWFPSEVFTALAAEGWLGLKYAGEWVADAVLVEELARCGSGGVAAGIGAHAHIANGVRADFYVTAVRTGGEGHGGVSLLVLERGDGVSASALSKLGWRASDTAELAFDEVYVPEENLLGEPGRGFALIMANFQWERLVMALGAVGAMRRTLERAVAELTGRGQVTRHRVAGLATRAEAATALTHHALRRYLAGADAVREVTMAKLATQRLNFELQEECLRLIGPDPELERAVRDARLGPIGGGTDEIMREILGRLL